MRSGAAKHLVSTHIVRFCTASLFGALATLAPGPLVHAQTAPAFGDSGWVAPLPPGALEGDPTTPGPRVAEKQSEPVGETILRAPFRLVFLPLRLVARGVEAGMGLAGENFLPRNDYRPTPPRRFKIYPTVLYAGGGDPTIGLRMVSVLDPVHDTRWSAAGSWSPRDARKAQFEYRRGTVTDGWGVRGVASYNYRPFRPYFGLGNFSSSAERSIYLGETGTIDFAARLGPVRRSVYARAGFGVTSARRGYNGTSPGVLEVFTPEEAPGMDDASQVLTYGVGGNFAFIDDLRDPSSGVHARFDAGQVDSRTGGDFDFLQVRAEGRAYVRVASKRRVVALRGLVHTIDPIRDDAVIPFYRLPEAASGETNFAAYRSHRFSDRYLALAHVEYRWLLLQRVWVLGMAEIGEVASSGNRLRIADVHESYGGGLRVALREDTVARFQLATGTEGLRAALTLNGDW